jgi:hypothetical protein
MPLRASPLRRLALSAAPLAAAVLAAACADSGPTASATGRLTVQLTDAPFPYDSVSRVDIFVVRADAKRDDADSSAAAQDVGDDGKNRGGWVTIAEPKGAYEMTALRDGVAAALGTATLPAGTYRAFRLVIDPAQSSVTLRNGTVLTSTSSPSIKFPSAGRSGIKIRLSAPVVVPVSAPDVPPPTLLIDFDLDDSFVLRGNSLGRDGLLFKPGDQGERPVAAPPGRGPTARRRRPLPAQAPLARGVLVELERPLDRDLRIERVAHRAVLGHGQLDGALGVGPLDAGAAQPVGELDADEPAGRAREPLAVRVDLERLRRRPPLGQDVDDVDRGARGERREHRVDHALPGAARAVESERRPPGAAGVEAVLPRPRHVHARRPPRRGGRRRAVLGGGAHAPPRPAARGRAGPVSIGARTAFPHSVQLPS